MHTHNPPGRQRTQRSRRQRGSGEEVAGERGSRQDGGKDRQVHSQRKDTNDSWEKREMGKKEAQRKKI